RHRPARNAQAVAGRAVGDDLGPPHRPMFLEQGQQIVGRGIPCEVADINVLRHRRTFPCQAPREDHSAAGEVGGKTNSYGANDPVDRDPAPPTGHTNLTKKQTGVGPRAGVLTLSQPAGPGDQSRRPPRDPWCFDQTGPVSDPIPSPALTQRRILSSSLLDAATAGPGLQGWSCPPSHDLSDRGTRKRECNVSERM